MLRSWWFAWLPIGLALVPPLGCSDGDEPHHRGSSSDGGEENGGETTVASGGTGAGRGGANSSGGKAQGTGGSGAGNSSAGTNSTGGSDGAGASGGSAGSSGSSATGGSDGAGASGGDDATGGIDAAGGADSAGGSDGAGAAGGADATGGTDAAGGSSGSAGTSSTGDDVRLFYDGLSAASGWPVTSSIEAIINLENHGTEAIPLGELTVRYWYSSESQAEDTTAFIDYCKRCEGEAVEIIAVERAGTDHVVEISWTGGSFDADPELDVQVNLRVSQDVFTADQNQANDWSCDPDRDAGEQEWDRITVYRNGVLIWGDEPGPA